MDTNILTRLQNWHLINCDGEWEHAYGISIQTLDNPGWTVKINLTDTCLHELQYEKHVDNGDFDWLFIKVKEKVFEAAGDTSKLAIIFETFLNEIILLSWFVTHETHHSHLCNASRSFVTFLDE